MQKKSEPETAIVSFDLSQSTAIALTRLEGAKVCARISQVSLSQVSADLSELFLMEHHEMIKANEPPRDYPVGQLTRKGHASRLHSSAGNLFFFLLGGVVFAALQFIAVFILFSQG